MVQAEMITLIAQRCGVTRERAKETLDDLFAEIASEIASGAAVRLPELGALEAYPTAERPGRNPRTGAAITIAAGYRLKFRAHASLLQRLATANPAQMKS